MEEQNAAMAAQVSTLKEQNAATQEQNATNAAKFVTLATGVGTISNSPKQPFLLTALDLPEM